MSMPSGWYDDPADPAQLRYWDGVIWSDRTVPKQSPTAAASTIGRTVSPYPPQPTHPGAPTRPMPGYGSAPSQQDYRQAPAMPWAAQGPTTADGAPLAQWWQRLLAALIDSFILQTVSVLLAFPWLKDFLTWYFDYLRRVSSTSASPDFTSLMNDMSAQMAKVVLPLTIISLIVRLAYETFFLTRSGATLGKMALGITVRRQRTPGPLSLVDALRRQALQIGLSVVGFVPIVGMVASLASTLDNAWLLWDPKRQTLHDKIADTVVVQTKPTQQRVRS